MSELLRKLDHFLRWLCAAERLPDPKEVPPAVEAERRPFLPWVLRRDLDLPDGPRPDRATRSRGFLRWLLQPESLPPCEDQGAIVTATTAAPFWRWVLTPETLSQSRIDLAGPRPPRHILRWLCAADSLPAAPDATVAAKKRSSVISWLFSPEELPTAQPKPLTAPPARKFWRWLLSAERCPHHPRRTERH